MVGLHAQRINGVTVCTVGSELWRGSLSASARQFRLLLKGLPTSALRRMFCSDAILIAENRCAACQIARTHLHRCRTFVPAQMCTRRSRPSTPNPLTIKIGPHIFLNRVPFDAARRASVQVGG